MISVTIKTILGLREALGGNDVSIELQQGATMMDALENVCQTFGKKFAGMVFDPESRKPYPYIRLMINGQDISFLGGLETQLEDGDTILMIPPAGGG